MLSFDNVSARYGRVPVLRDISFSVRESEILAIFGHNGAGKTTLMRCAVGEIADVSGRVTWRGEPVIPRQVFRNARQGIGFVPQGHNVFRDLSVRQNLTIAGLHHAGGAVDDVYRLFPVLKERASQFAGSLSGGQQQILALGMALMTKPSILLLDEPSTGLAPVIVRDMFASLSRINQETGATIVIVEQNIPATLPIASRAVVLKSGRIVFDGPSAALQSHHDLWDWF